MRADPRVGVERIGEIGHGSLENLAAPPPIGGFSTVEWHRRVREGAGALRFYTMAFPMAGELIWTSH